MLVLGVCLELVCFGWCLWLLCCGSFCGFYFCVFGGFVLDTLCFCMFCAYFGLLYLHRFVLCFLVTCLGYGCGVRAGVCDCV